MAFMVGVEILSMLLMRHLKLVYFITMVIHVLIVKDRGLLQTSRTIINFLLELKLGKLAIIDVEDSLYFVKS